MVGNSLSHFCLDLLGKDFMYLTASWFPIYFISFELGVPNTDIILET